MPKRGGRVAPRRPVANRARLVRRLVNSRFPPPHAPHAHRAVCLSSHSVGSAVRRSSVLCTEIDVLTSRHPDGVRPRTSAQCAVLYAVIGDTGGSTRRNWVTPHKPNSGQRARRDAHGNDLGINQLADRRRVAFPRGTPPWRRGKAGSALIRPHVVCQENFPLTALVTDSTSHRPGEIRHRRLAESRQQPIVCQYS